MMKSDTRWHDGRIVSVQIADNGAVTAWATLDGEPCAVPDDFPLPVIDMSEAPADGE